MRHTFIDLNDKTRVVIIPDDWIAKTKASLNLTTTEAVDLWLCDNGYAENAEQIKLNNAAKGVKINTGAGRKKRKVNRKPDKIKRQLIADLADFLENHELPRDINIKNVERIISFTIGDDSYEVTLSKKRKPK